MRLFGGAMLIMTWLRLEGIPYFSMRIWWIVLALVAIVLMGLECQKWRKMRAAAAAPTTETATQSIEKKYTPGLKKGRK